VNKLAHRSYRRRIAKNFIDKLEVLSTGILYRNSQSFVAVFCIQRETAEMEGREIWHNKNKFVWKRARKEFLII
jgi:hypothetical protein